MNNINKQNNQEIYYTTKYKLHIRDAQNNPFTVSKSSGYEYDTIR